MSEAEPKATADRPKALRLGTQLVLAAALLIAAITASLVGAWVHHSSSMIDDDARQEAIALAVTLADSHYANLAQRNHAQLQLDFTALAEQAPDVAYLIATDTSDGRIVAAVPADLVGSMVPDVVPLAVTRKAPPRTGARPTPVATFLLREAALGSVPGEPVFDVVDDITLQDNTRIGTLRVGIRSSRQRESLRAAATRAGLVGALALLVGIVAASFLARRIARPVEALGARMARVAEGELQEAAIEGGPAEIRALAAAYDTMITGLKQKRALERYVPLGARRVIDERASEQGIVAPRREMAVILFSDLRGFSTLSEKSTPSEVLEMLNSFADAMAEVVVSCGGDVNELLGDAVLAVFTGEDACTNAVRCGLAMQEKLAGIANGALRMGVGLHRGDVVLGTVGTMDRLKFAVVGDAVNVAARIQEKARGGEGSAVLASEEVRSRAGSGFAWVDKGEMPVRGRAGTVKLWELALVAAPPAVVRE
ncbi:MAG: adenylate/guanylate cyclase domain-containing protein [Deltaproteobacteria bacterium]|nr:adenylate/guanylate cyclase domain-containing protein [Deltaproteobacteria bacterium]